MSEARAPLAAGDILAGKYRVERVLGVGGMGVVVAARHLELDERVAVKFLLPEIAENADAVARFLQEGRAAVKIRSEHVARVLDVGRLESGAPYLVMEYLEGEDIAQMLDRGPLSLVVATDFLLQASEAIAEAHSLGIVHRDLKPANFFVTLRADGSPCVKVLDFGIAKTLQGLGAHGPMGLTSTSNVVGTPLYMSPEQLASSPHLDQRADVWSLGVILFEMLTREAPFYGDTMPQLCTSIISHPPRAVRELRPDMPGEVASVIARCLEKMPADRYANIGELAAALAPHASSEGRASAERVRRVVAGRASVADGGPVSQGPSTRAAVTAGGITLPDGRRASSKSSLLLGVIAGVLTVVAAVIVILLWPRRAPDSPTRLADTGASSSATGPIVGLGATETPTSTSTSTATSTATSTSTSTSTATSTASAADSAKVPTKKVPGHSNGPLRLPEGRK